jgi:Rieske Fe-S protein
MSGETRPTGPDVGTFMDHSHPETDPETDVDPARPADGASRRQVLGLAVAAGAGLPLLAACGGGGDEAGTDAGSSGPAGGDSPAPAQSSAAPAGPLVATADVPVKGGVILDQQKVVVTQPAEGTFKAFTATCTHMACTVGSVKNNVISCPCHGSAYSAMDGSVENGPATRALREISVKVEGDQVVEA